MRRSRGTPKKTRSENICWLVKTRAAHKKNHHKTKPMMHRTSSVHNGHRQIFIKTLVVRRSHFSTQLLSQTHDSLNGHTWQHEYRGKTLCLETHRTNTSSKFERKRKGVNKKQPSGESENTDNTPKNAMNKTFVGETKTETATFSLKRKSRAGLWYHVGQIW